MRSIAGREVLTKFPIETASKVAVFAASFVVVVFLLSFEKEPLRWSGVFPQGEPAPRSFFAPFGLTLVNEASTATRRESERQGVPDVYDVDVRLNANRLASLDEAFEAFKRARANPAAGVSWDQLKVDVSGTTVKTLLDSDPDVTHPWAREAVKRSQDQGVMDFAKKIELLNEGKRKITMRGIGGPEKEKVLPLKGVTASHQAYEDLKRLAEEKFPKDRKLQSALIDLMAELVEPNLLFNEAETVARQKKAYESVPGVAEEIKKNQMIVQKGAIVTDEIFKKLEAIEAKRLTRQIRLRILGIGLFVLFVFLVLAWFLYFLEGDIWQSFKRLLLIHVLLIFLLSVERLGLSAPYAFVHYLLPANLFPLALTLLLNRRVGFMASVVISLLNALLAGFNPEVFLYSFFGSVVGTFAAIGLRKRSQFLKVGSAMALAHFFAIFGYHILQDAPIQEAVHLGSYGIMNAFLISLPMLFLLLPILEHVFGLVTDITLLELSDLNHPLLRRMVIEAPGTYHHSLVVSSLAEAACEVIRANSLLARVGGYFHDIGKIEKAEYFTENQMEKDKDRHGRLSPSMSYLIIASHVKDGIDLAKKYRLKEAIVDFIPQHQGTCPVYYFYKKAATDPSHEEKINIDDYRYPGPKPQTKETAVVLLADSVEAASRSLTNVTPQAIEDLVQDVINNKFIDGQLDECDLTLQDVRKIQESFVHNMIGIFHTRIQYPKSDAEPLWQKIVDRKVE